MRTTVQVHIKHVEGEQAEIIIAILSEWGYHAFEEKDTLIAYIDEQLFDEKVLLNEVPFTLEYSFESIGERNWNAIWESEFKPVVMGDFVAVRAGFHPPNQSVLHDLVITPKMSFGTAHHATTYMMIEQMRHVDFKNKRVLDFGTGTGILAILASRLGANEIVAIDDDDLSIENCMENISVNGCNNITVLKKDSPVNLGMFDIILANINLSVILQHIELLKSSSPSALLLLSGFLLLDADAIVKKCTLHGYRNYIKIEREGWMCLQCS